MTIAQSTTIQAYQLRKGGTPARMAILRMVAADSANNRNESTRLQPGDWRKARSYTMKTYVDAYVHGIHQCAGQWYTHGGEQFRNERDAGDISDYVRRNTGGGWYTDVYQYGLAIGIVASLSHGRFIAGYRWTDNDERVYFPGIFSDAETAARMADEHARVFAEDAREDSERAQAAMQLQDENENALIRLRECIALRHRQCMGYVRDEIANLIEQIRANRKRLTGEFADYV